MGVTPLMAEALGHLVPWEAAPVSHVPRLIGMTLSSHVPIWVITCLFQESGERGGGELSTCVMKFVKTNQQSSPLPTRSTSYLRSR